MSTKTQQTHWSTRKSGRGSKGRISFNAEDGVVFLRGTVDDRATIAAVEHAVRRVHGVRAVENLLHLPGTEARMHE